jgi:hypothetical protein
MSADLNRIVQPRPVEHIRLGMWIHCRDDLGTPIWSRVADIGRHVQRGSGRTLIRLAAIDYGTGETTGLGLRPGALVPSITAAQARQVGLS